MSLYESGQMYLETIYVLSKENACVRAIDVGEELGYSKPSVSRAMSILKKEGYVTATEDGCLVLTEKGRQEAETMYVRHTVLTKLLMGLGVDEETAAEDGCRIEHVISEKSFAAMQEHMAKMEKQAQQ
jgi:Mn-dependent DtxR family transcriptional regulator